MQSLNSPQKLLRHYMFAYLLHTSPTTEKPLYIPQNHAA